MAPLVMLKYGSACSSMHASSCLAYGSCQDSESPRQDQSTCSCHHDPVTLVHSQLHLLSSGKTAGCRA